MKTKNGILYLAIALIAMLIACEDEKKEVQTYVDKWQTEEFLNVAAGAYQQIIFDFSEEDFEATIKAGQQGLLATFMGVKGTLDPSVADTVLGVSITDIGMSGATGFDYKNRISEAQEFLGIYNQTLTGQIPLDFNAIYSIDDNKMDLQVQVDMQGTLMVVDTIHLYLSE